MQFITSSELQRSNWPDKDEKESFTAVTCHLKSHAYDGQIAINKSAIDLSNTEVKNQQKVLDACNNYLRDLKAISVCRDVEKEELEDEFETIKRQYFAMKSQMDLKLEELSRAKSNVEDQYARCEDASTCLDEKRKSHEKLLESIDYKFGWFGAGTDYEVYHGTKKGEVNEGGKKVFLSEVTADQFFQAADPSECHFEEVITNNWSVEQQIMFRRLLLNCGWDQNPLFKTRHDKLRLSQRRPGQDAPSFQAETLEYLPERSIKLTSSAAPTKLMNASPLLAGKRRKYRYDDIMSDEEKEEVRGLLDLPPMSPANELCRRHSNPSTPLRTISEENTIDLKGPLIPTPDDVWKHKDV